MRLIDADKMKKYMRDTTSKELMENEEVFEIIDEQPTISFGNIAELNWKKVSRVSVKEDGEEVFLIEGVSYVNHQILFRIFDCECRENDRYTVSGAADVFVIKSENKYGIMKSVLNTKTNIIRITHRDNRHDRFIYTILPLPSNQSEINDILKRFLYGGFTAFPILI